MTDIKLIACDLDGTLLSTDKSLSERNRKAIEACGKNGIYFVPATGRYYNGIPEPVRSIPSIKYAITINGAAVWDIYERKTVYEANIPVDTALHLLEYFDSLGVAYNFYAGNKGFMDRYFIDNIIDYMPAPEYQKTARILYTPVDDIFAEMRDNYDQVQKVQIFTREREKLFETSRYIESLGLPLITTSGYVHNLEVNHKDANKGTALKKLAEYLDIDINETAAFGDGGNDLRMFDTAGYSIAMANAIPPVREAASYHTLSNNEDGVAYFIEKYILDLE